MKAEIENVNGKDPYNSHSKAIEYLKTAAGIRPEHYSAYNNIAVALIALARYDMSNNADPRGKLKQAIDYCNKTIRLLPVGLAVTIHWAMFTLFLKDTKQHWNQLRGLTEACNCFIKQRSSSQSKAPRPIIESGNCAR